MLPGEPWPGLPPCPLDHSRFPLTSGLVREDGCSHQLSPLKVNPKCRRVWRWRPPGSAKAREGSLGCPPERPYSSWLPAALGPLQGVWSPAPSGPPCARRLPTAWPGGSFPPRASVFPSALGTEDPVTLKPTWLRESGAVSPFSHQGHGPRAQTGSALPGLYVLAAPRPAGPPSLSPTTCLSSKSLQECHRGLPIHPELVQVGPALCSQGLCLV